MPPPPRPLLRAHLRLAFLGTPDFAVPSLAAVADAGAQVAAVYTQPARPRGRGHAARPSPVQDYADARGWPVRTPASMKDPGEAAAFAALELDLAVVVAYGQILPPAVLEAPRLGCWNLHGSLLPRWRGAAPIQRAIMAGDERTAAQVMRMGEALDDGPVLLTAPLSIADDDTAATLSARMAREGAALWPRALDLLARGEARPAEQVGEPTYARKITPAEARLDWARPAIELDRRVRALSPYPGAWFEAPSPRGPVRVKALLGAPVPGWGAPGEVLEDRTGLVVATGEGGLRLLRLQREGRGAQDAADFLRGLPLPAGVRLPGPDLGPETAA